MLASRLRCTVHGPMWHGDALLELLADVTPAVAHAHPIRGAHSIWELVLHVTAWAAIARDRLAHEHGRDPTEAGDWPAPPASPSEGAWAEAKASLAAAYEALAIDARACSDATLRRTVPGRDYDNLAMIAGVVEHGAYHGGQIALLKHASR